MAGAHSNLGRELDFSSVERTIASARGKPLPKSLASMPLPKSILTEKASKYALEATDPAIFNHCVRTYYLGAIAAVDQFAELEWDPETFYLSSVLHDLGLSKAAIDNTFMSFIFYSAIMAREFLIKEGAPKQTGDLVFENIARYSDIEWRGSHPEGILVRIGSFVDVFGTFHELFHKESVHNIVAEYPRLDLVPKLRELIAYEVEKKKNCHSIIYLEKTNEPNHLFLEHDQPKIPRDGHHATCTVEEHFTKSK